MALVPGGVIPVSGSGIFPIPYPPTGGLWTQVKIENATAYGLTLSFDGVPVHSVPAGVADVFPLTLGPSGPGSPPMSPSTMPAPQLTVTTVSEPAWGDTPGSIRPSFGQYGDQFPGSYPLSLAAQAGPVNSVTTPYLTYSGSTGPSSNVQLLPPPAAGNFWEISLLSVWVLAPGATAAGYASLEGLPHDTFLLLTIAATAPGNVGSATSAAHFTYAGAVYLNNQTNASAASVGGTIIARQVPPTFAPV